MLVVIFPLSVRFDMILCLFWSHIFVIVCHLSSKTLHLVATRPVTHRRVSQAVRNQVERIFGLGAQFLHLKQTSFQCVSEVVSLCLWAGLERGDTDNDVVRSWIITDPVTIRYHSTVTHERIHRRVHLKTRLKKYNLSTYSTCILSTSITL